MSVGEEDVRREEVVIVRRRGGNGDDGHHGGVWKVAYADFMTAMMAFFLMMWLVNAANKDTRAQVASYFNPLRLADTITSRKGLKELQPGEQSRKGLEDPQDSKKQDSTSKPDKSESTQGQMGDLGQDKSEADISAEELFSDPYGVLAKLASQAKSSKSGFAEKKGAAFRDPFDPNFRRSEGIPSPIRTRTRTQPGEVVETDKIAKAAQALTVADAAKADKTTETTKDKAEKQVAEKPANSWSPKITTSQELPEKKPTKGKAELEKEKSKSSKLASAEDKAKEAKAKEAAAKEAAAKEAQAKAVARLRQSLETIAAQQAGKGPKFDLRTVKEGTLISLTDSANFTMFRSASVVPLPQVVAFFEQLGEVIAKEEGEIVIAGHTDARPFRSNRYDNWRLSTDRAHIAYHMLVRGGTPADRIVRVEGHAARRPRIVADPNASANRRVEILIRRQDKS